MVLVLLEMMLDGLPDCSPLDLGAYSCLNQCLRQRRRKGQRGDTGDGEGAMGDDDQGVGGETAAVPVQGLFPASGGAPPSSPIITRYAPFFFTSLCFTPLLL